MDFRVGLWWRTVLARLRAKPVPVELTQAEREELLPHVPECIKLGNDGFYMVCGEGLISDEQAIKAAVEVGYTERFRDRLQAR